VARAKSEYCLRGHLRTPETVTRNGTCKICMKEYHRSYYGNTPSYRDKRQARAKSADFKAERKITLSSPENVERKRVRSIKATHGLSDGYVAQKLHMLLAETTPELIEIKRQHMLLKRELKKCRQ